MNQAESAIAAIQELSRQLENALAANKSLLADVDRLEVHVAQLEGLLEEKREEHEKECEAHGATIARLRDAKNGTFDALDDARALLGLEPGDSLAAAIQSIRDELRLCDETRSSLATELDQMREALRKREALCANGAVAPYAASRRTDEHLVATITDRDTARRERDEALVEAGRYKVACADANEDLRAKRSERDQALADRDRLQAELAQERDSHATAIRQRNSAEAELATVRGELEKARADVKDLECELELNRPVRAQSSEGTLREAAGKLLGELRDLSSKSGPAGTAYFIAADNLRRILAAHPAPSPVQRDGDEVPFPELDRLVERWEGGNRTARDCARELNATIGVLTSKTSPSEGVIASAEDGSGNRVAPSGEESGFLRETWAEGRRAQKEAADLRARVEKAVELLRDVLKFYPTNISPGAKAKIEWVTEHLAGDSSEDGHTSESGKTATTPEKATASETTGGEACKRCRDFGHDKPCLACAESPTPGVAERIEGRLEKRTFRASGFDVVYADQVIHIVREEFAREPKQATAEIPGVEWAEGLRTVVIKDVDGIESVELCDADVGNRYDGMLQVTTTHEGGSCFTRYDVAQKLIPLLSRFVATGKLTGGENG